MYLLTLSCREWAELPLIVAFQYDKLDKVCFVDDKNVFKLIYTKIYTFITLAIVCRLFLNNRNENWSIKWNQFLIENIHFRWRLCHCYWRISFEYKQIFHLNRILLKMIHLLYDFLVTRWGKRCWSKQSIHRNRNFIRIILVYFDLFSNKTYVDFASIFFNIKNNVCLFAMRPEILFTSRRWSSAGSPM